MIKKFICWFWGHDWTCYYIELNGIVPEHLLPLPEDSVEDITNKFREYSKMWCKRCKVKSNMFNKQNKYDTNHAI